MTSMIATLSGKTFENVGPNVSQCFDETGVEYLFTRKRGKGSQVGVCGSPDQLEDLMDWLRMVGESWLQLDADSRADGRACLKDADRLERILTNEGHLS